MAGMRDLMSGYADAASDTLGRWANGLRGAVGGAPAGGVTQDIPGMTATEAPMTNAEGRAFGVKTGPTAAEGMLGSAEDWNALRKGAANYAGDQAARSFAMEPAGTAGRVLGSTLRGLGKAAAPVGFGVGLYDTAKAAQEGDYRGAALGAGDAAASAGLLTPAAPVAGAYLAARGAQHLYDTAPRGVQDVIGGTVNSIAQRFGGGVDDSAYLADKAAVNTGQVSPLSGARAPVAMAPNLAANPNATTDVQRGGAAAGEQGTAVANADGVRRLSPTSYTNVSGDNTGQTGFGVSSLGGGPEALGREQRAADIYKQMAAEQQGSGAIVLPDTGGYGLRDKATLDARNSGIGNSLQDLVHSGISPRTAATFINAQHANTVALRGQDINRLNNQENNATSLRRTGMENETSRANNLGTTGAAIYGHELSRAGIRAQLEYERQKFGVTNDLAQREFGLRTQDSNRAATAAGNDLVQKELEARFRAPNADGTGTIPDTQKIADFRSAAATTSPFLAQELDKIGTPEAKAKAADVRKRNISAFEPGDFERMHQLFDLRSRLAASRGLGPNQGNYTHSDNLLDFMQAPQGVQQRALGGNRIVTRNGSSASVNDLRYKDGPANALLPDFNKVQTNDLTRGLRTE